MPRYFKICLWSPLWFPGLLVGLLYGAEAIWPRAYDVLPDWLQAIGLVLVMSLVLGGVQYLVTLFFVWPRINFYSAASWRKWVLRLPLIFAPLQFAGLLLFAAWNFESWYRFSDFLPIAAFSLVLGYVYVFVWMLGYGVLAWVEGGRRAPA